MVIHNPFARRVLFILGCLSLATGLVGIFLPVLPTTPFVLLAAGCFLRSSPKAHQWILRQPHLGRAITDWETRGAIARPAKITALTTMALSLVIMWFMVQVALLKVLITVCLAAVAMFIVTRPSR